MSETPGAPGPTAPSDASGGRYRALDTDAKLAVLLGLILVVIAGSHLLTGNMMLVPIR